LPDFREIAPPQEAQPFRRRSSESAARRPLRIALLADQLLTVAGSEQIFLHMTGAFPEADIFTLAYNRETTLPEFKGLKVRASWMSWLLRDHRRFKLMFLPATIFMERWRFDDYDVVLSSSATTSKYIGRSKAIHICYCYFPTRAIWDADSYFGGEGGTLAQRAFRALLGTLRRRDLAAAKRIDAFITISQTARQAIRNIYDRESTVLFSPVPVERFQAGLRETKEDFYLIVSRLESWKRIDYAIDAFNQLGLPLHIIGTGVEEDRLRAMARPNIQFLGAQSQERLIQEYGRAKAVIFTPALEYGLVPLEAAAAGTPVIALGYGGVRETMIGKEDAAKLTASPTAIFFGDQTAEALIAAVREFEGTRFDRAALSDYAAQFGVANFQRRLRELVEGFVASRATP
jgi:glycosyltransferase involved in cell wall biosynthesis